MSELPYVDRAEWADVYKAHAARLNRLATLLVGPTDAHDLVADAVLRAVGSRRWRSVEAPGAYLARTLVNLADDGRRDAARRAARELKSSRLIAPLMETSGSGGRVDDRIVVRRALTGLTPAQLAVVYLHYWEDLTLEQTAAELDVSVGTVRKQVDRAKRRLRSALTPSEPAVEIVAPSAPAAEAATEVLPPMTDIGTHLAPIAEEGRVQ